MTSLVSTSDLDKIDVSSERINEINLEEIRPNLISTRKTFENEAAQWIGSFNQTIWRIPT